MPRPRRCRCYVLPPHMLSSVIHNTTDQSLRKRMVRTMSRTSQLLGARNILASMPTVMAQRVSDGPYRLVYDARNKGRTPGSLVRREGQPATGDPCIDEAFDGAGAVYEFYRAVFNRTSLDNKGMMLASSVHYMDGYDNAYFDGSEMVYGDGDGTLFKRFTSCIDVIGHELTHGVTQFTSGLVYENESGAINEHLSDAFGSMIKQRLSGQTAETSDWLIGAGLLAPGVHGVALRSMRNPGTAYDDPLLGKDPQPASVKNLVNDPDDDGGVHINSGPLNKAFCEAALGIGGPTWLKAGRIWYDVAVRRLWADAKIQDLADLTVQAAGDLFGVNGQEQRAVRDGWKQVDVTVK